MKKCIVIYNPNSGKVIKKDFQDKFEKILNDYNYEAVFFKTQYKNHAKEIVLKIDVCDLVVEFIIYIIIFSYFKNYCIEQLKSIMHK